MRKGFLKKSHVIREGYVNGLKAAQRVLDKMLAESRGEKENEADVNELNFWLLSAAQDDDIATARQVVRDGADVNVQDDEKYTPLYYASEYDSEAVAKFLLKHHADPNIKNGGGFAPLHASASNDSAVITELLIQHGADVNVKDKCNRTPLTWAAMEGKKENVKVLLRNGADVNVVDKGRNHVGGATPFDHAWENGYAEICKLLRQYGGKPAERK